MSLMTSEGDTLFIAAALTEGWREGWCHWFKMKCQKKKKLQQIPLCSGGHKAICLDFNYEGLWERGTLGSSMNHCHSASLPLFSWIKTLPAQVASLLVIKKPRKCCFHFLVGAERISQIAECLFLWTSIPPENSGWEQVKHESKPQETCY